MADLKTGAKFIDQDPPLADQETKSVGRKIIDYLAYLKERLNFIFSNYGRRLTDADGHINELTRTADEMSSTIYDPNTGESRIQQNADAISVVVDSNDDIKAASIVAAINDSGSSVIIDADHIALSGYVTFDNLSTSGQTAIDGANITTGTISADRIGAGSITSAKLDSAVTTAISDAASAASAAQTTANGANSQEQLIYISKASGTTSVSANTTWVTNTADTQNTWTLKRPTYAAAYPVLFVATQRKTVGGTVTCTTPMKDDTTTVIDGGHITTGTIDASQVTVSNINAGYITTGTIKDAANKNSWDLTTGAFSITDGSLSITTSSGTDDKIKLKYGTFSLSISPYNIIGTSSQGEHYNADTINGYLTLGGNGTSGRLQIKNSSSNVQASLDSSGVVSGNIFRTGNISGPGQIYIYNETQSNTANWVGYFGSDGIIYRSADAYSGGTTYYRVVLNQNGLSFRNSSGTETAFYPATGVSISPTHLSGSNTSTSYTAGTYKYSGVSFTIPAGKYFVCTAHAYYSAVSPSAVCISSSSTSLGSGAMQIEGLVDSQNTRARVTWSGYLSSATTYYIWAKSAANGVLGVGLDGFYL